MKLRIPYGKTGMTVEIPEDRVIRSRIDELSSDRPGIELVREAMEAPIGSPRLRELAKGKKTACLIVSDHTRPVPSRDIVPLMLKEMREGNPDIDITILVATGLHRESSLQELTAKLGEDIVKSEKIVVHDGHIPENNVEIGVLPSGSHLVIDKIAYEAELLVSEGFIEPHMFAGFSGGRKSILPGICDAETIRANHCGKIIADPNSRIGKLDGNPVNIDMETAAAMAGLDFIVNVIIDADKKTVAAFAGHYKEAHRAGCEFLRKYCEVDPLPADIVITTNGGAPLDQNLYQTAKGLIPGEAMVKQGGTIIICAEMADGIGGELFRKQLMSFTDPEKYFNECIAVPQYETELDQWESQIMARIMMKARIIYVTRPEMKETVEELGFGYARDVDEALAIAGPGSVTVIPDGISIVVRS